MNKIKTRAHTEAGPTSGRDVNMKKVDKMRWKCFFQRLGLIKRIRFELIPEADRMALIAFLNCFQFEIQRLFSKRPTFKYSILDKLILDDVETDESQISDWCQNKRITDVCKSADYFE